MTEQAVTSPRTLLEWAQLIDNRLGPISGAHADAMAEAFRAAHADIERRNELLRELLDVMEECLPAFIWGSEPYSRVEKLRFVAMKQANDLLRVTQ